LWKEIDMDKCLECGSELSQTVGKRKKMYCGNTCRVKYFLKKKNEGRVYKKRGRKPKPTTSIGVLREAIQNMGNTPIAVSVKEKPQMPKGLSLDERIKWLEENK
jgi:hypothetical protein